MPPSRGRHLVQAHRYYVGSHLTIDAAFEQFRQDLETTNNLALPILGLYLAAERSVSRMRIAPIAEISPHDLPFARAAGDVFAGGFVGLRFEMSQRRAYGVPWVGSVTLRSAAIEQGFGYDRADLSMASSPDALGFRTNEGVEEFVDCADLAGSPNAADTTLRIAPSKRGEVLDRYAMVRPPVEPPQQL